MVVVRFQFNNKIVAEKTLPEAPREGQTLCFFSYKAEDLKIMNYKVFEVINVGLFLKDPMPPEGYINRNVGTDHYVATIKPRDVQKIEPNSLPGDDPAEVNDNVVDDNDDSPAEDNSADVSPASDVPADLEEASDIADDQGTF